VFSLRFAATFFIFASCLAGCLLHQCACAQELTPNETSSAEVAAEPQQSVESTETQPAATEIADSTAPEATSPESTAQVEPENKQTDSVRDDSEPVEPEPRPAEVETKQVELGEKKAEPQTGETVEPEAKKVEPAAIQTEPGSSQSGEILLPSSSDLFPTYMLLGVLLIALAVASIVGQYMRRQPSESMNPALIRRFRQRVNAWWLMSAILAFSLALHATGAVLLFFLTSFWALREFITMAPTRRGDHRALFWALIVFTPLQYVLIGIERLYPSRDMYGLYSIMIPVYASIFVPARIALSGDAKRFLERSAQVTSGLLICVYALSHAPAMLNLKLVTSDGTKWTGSTAGLLCFFVLLTQLSEILQWTWGQVVGKRMIASEISTSRTWEGFLGGTLSLGVVGAVLWWVTPFSIWEAACMSMVIGVMGMFGGMTMSAIKRDRGVNDYGSLVLGHAGVLDRIDTLCFAAPVFYHLTRYFFT
jgi:phosphatidate cytidylyltransferase